MVRLGMGLGLGRARRRGASVIPAPDPLFASDAFGGANGDAIIGRTADRGGIWTRHPFTNYTAGAAEIRGGRIRRSIFGGSGTGEQFLAYLPTLGQSNTQVIRCLFTPETLNGNNLGVVGYLHPTQNTFYGTRYVLGSTRWEIYGFLNNVNIGSPVVATGTATLTAGHVYEMVTIFELGSQALWIRDVTAGGSLTLACSATNQAIQGPGYVGIRGTGSISETTSTGLFLDEFEANQGLQTVDLFWSTEDGGPVGTAESTYNALRIPSQPVVTNDGTLVVAAEGRIPDQTDDTPSDVLIFTGSQSDWTSWSDGVAVDLGEFGSSGSQKLGPSLAHDPSTDRIHLFAARYRLDAGSPRYGIGECLFGHGPDNTGTIRYTYSDNDGVDWAEYVDITPQIKSAATSGPTAESLILTGNANALVKTRSPSIGRICCPIRVERGSEPTGGGPGALTRTNHYASLIYTDDGGLTFARGADIPGGTGNSQEIQIAEDVNGDLVAFVRNGVAGAWSYAISTDAGETWGSLQTVAAIQQPVVMCGFAIGASGRWYVTHPNSGTQGQRKNLTVRWSDDRGATWNDATVPAENYPGGTRIETAGASYSTILVREQAPYRDLLVVFERGRDIGYANDRVSIVRVPLSWLGIS